MKGESWSLGGDEWRSDLMVDQRRLQFLKALLMHLTLDNARDLFINLFVGEQAARLERRSDSALEAFQRRSSLRFCFLASIASGGSQFLVLLGQKQCLFVYLYEEVRRDLCKINNNICIISKITIKMAAWNFNLMYLSCSALRYKEKLNV